MASLSDTVVILHQFREFGIEIPVVNGSPPCLKLETFLRMAKIPYKVDNALKASSKGKFPWIEHKGRSVDDSAFCIEYLSKEFGVDLDSELTPEQKAISIAFRVMLEENTYWPMVHYRWFSDYAPKFKEIVLAGFSAPIKSLLAWKFQRNIRNMLHGHGIGRHTDVELYGIAERDLRAVSVFLGSKKFLFGDTPCLTDVALFALVANLGWALLGSPQERVIKNDLPNLIEHAQRFKETYYPDWDQIISGKRPSDQKVGKKAK